MVTESGTLFGTWWVGEVKPSSLQVGKEMDKDTHHGHMEWLKMCKVLKEEARSSAELGWALDINFYLERIEDIYSLWFIVPSFHGVNPQRHSHSLFLPFPSSLSLLPLSLSSLVDKILKFKLLTIASETQRAQECI